MLLLLILFLIRIYISINARKLSQLKDPITGRFLELDLWIPNYNLSFEFQVCNEEEEERESIEGEQRDKKGGTNIPLGPIPLRYNMVFSHATGIDPSKRQYLYQIHSLPLPMHSSHPPSSPYAL